jgi:hypothetical protein
MAPTFRTANINLYFISAKKYIEKIQFLPDSASRLPGYAFIQNNFLTLPGDFNIYIFLEKILK